MVSEEKQEEVLMEYEAFVSRDAVDDDEWRVEAIDYGSEGECYIAIFSGPEARERAEEYAAFKNKRKGLNDDK